jgi:predicted CXXCH cytochrome family protein
MEKLLKFYLLHFITPCIFVFLPAWQASAQQSCVTTECHTFFQDGKNIHPEKTECGSCHLDITDEHLKAESKPTLKQDTCISCHEGILGQPYMHAPVGKGECSLCHNPHGDRENRYLPESYSRGDFISYSEKEYRFCFSCHKRELLMFPDTGFSTGFRDGLRNLHYLHVNRIKRGKNCKLCHAMHGGTLEKLVADKVLFGNWNMPLNFQKSETGGKCSPGCHASQQYDRKNRKAEQEESK